MRQYLALFAASAHGGDSPHSSIRRLITSRSALFVFQKPSSLENSTLKSEKADTRMTTVVSEGRKGGNERYSPHDEVTEQLPDVDDIKLNDDVKVPSFERLPSPTPRYFGSCKWFNVSKGYGFVIDDITKEDLFVHQSNLNMQGFRSLDEGERVSYYIQERSNGKGREAYAVSGEVEGQGLKGSRIHPLGRKKAVSLRCFRCGKFATHKAKSCPNVKTDTKVCYTCGSEEHVSSICPERRRKHRPEQVAAEEAEAARIAAEKSTTTTPQENEDVEERNEDSDEDGKKRNSGE